VALAMTDVATALLQCAFDGVDNTGDLEISRVCFVPGEIAWDNCMCGQLAITEVRRYPSRAFPLEEIDHTAECGAPWLVVNFLISLVRCVPIPGDDGEPPSCAELNVAAIQLSTDMGNMRRAVECCLDAMYNANTVAAYRPAGKLRGVDTRCAGRRSERLWL
jgi:hypothetical protein